MAHLGRDLNERTRLWQLVFSVWVSFANSGTYGVSGYLTPILKAAPHFFSQSDLALIGAVSGVSVSVTVGTGYIFDRWGSRGCLRIGAVLYFIGSGLLALMFCVDVVPVTIALMIVANSFIGQAYSFLETGSFVTNLATFARDKGSILLVEESLGGAIFAAWYVGFMRKSATTLVLFAVFFAPLVTVAASFFIEKPVVQEEDIPWHGHRRFTIAYVVVAVTLLFYTSTDVIQNFVVVTAPMRLAFAAFGVVVVLAYALVPLFGNDLGYKDPHPNRSFVDISVLQDDEEISAPSASSWHHGHVDPPGLAGDDAHGGQLQKAPRSSGHDTAGVGVDDDASRQLIVGPATERTRGVESSTPSVPDERKRGVTLIQTLQTPELWLIFAVSMVQWGVSEVVGSNTIQIYEALNNGQENHTTTAVYFSIMSIFNAVGRCVIAIADSYFPNKAFLLMFAPPIMGLSALCIALLPVQGLILGFLLNGLGDSLSWAARALVLKQLFNGRSFGLIYNFVFTLAVFSPFLFNLGMFAPLYDAEARRLQTFPNCPQRSCISTAMGICVAISVVGTVAGVVLYRRTQRRLDARTARGTSDATADGGNGLQ